MSTEDFENDEDLNSLTESQESANDAETSSSLSFEDTAIDADATGELAPSIPNEELGDSHTTTDDVSQQDDAQEADEDVDEGTSEDPDATTDMWASNATPESLQQTRTPTIRSELLSLPELDDNGTPTDASSQPDDQNDAREDEGASEPVTVPRGSVTTGFGAGGFASTVDPDESPRSSVLKRILMVLGIIFGVLLLIYLIGSVFFISHFMPNTQVNGEDVSWMSIDDLAAKVTQTGKDYTTHVSGDQVDLNISAADIELKYDGAAYGADAATQIEPWKWPAKIFKSHDFHVNTGITFNSSLLEAIINNAVGTINAAATPPTNAAMSFDATKTEFVKTADALGTMVDNGTTIATVSEGIRTLQDSIALGDKELVQPLVRIDDERLDAVVEQANKIAKTKVPLRVAGRDALSIDSSLIKNWLLTNENCELIIDTEKITEWAQGDFSKTFDSVGSTRKYVRPDGKEVTVSGGDYGWNIDGAELANLIGATLLNNLSTPIEVPMKATAAEWNPGGADWGKRYIDVDMGEQHVRVYDENSQMVLESDCVTGVPGHATDEGVYAVYEHTPNATLVGFDYNGDGQPDYQTPVSYWMPFNGGQGLHDAYWRGAFGGNIYEYDGSHGCVNLPSDVAAQLFDWCVVGDVVVVHW